MLDIQSILDAYGSDIRTIAKIEIRKEWTILMKYWKWPTGVMVARGDLGIEVPQERFPGIQRLLIKKSILGKETGDCCYPGCCIP